MARVTLTSISKRFADGTKAISDLSLSIEDGELLVLLGPSGCGKSTLLRMVAGLESPTCGEIRIDDTVVNELSPQQRNIAMVFQNYALYPHMSVAHNLAFPLKMQRLPRREIERRIHVVAQRLGLGDLLDKTPGALSGGQRQRVAMGRALVREPKVFLMDEPLSNLDAELRLQIRQDISRLQRDTGITTIYVTHDQVEAMTLGQRIVVLKQGVVQQLGTAHELYARPANTFVARFIGSPGMNIFPATVQRNDQGYGLSLAERPLSLQGSGYSYESLSAFAGKTLQAGIRPEAMRLVADDDEGVCSLSVRLSGVERLGHEVIVHFAAINRAAGSQMEHSARLAYQDRLELGDDITLGFVLTDLYLFDEDGQAIPRKGFAIDNGLA
ncbi:MAG: ABC transporter ATP-binding protein [Lysobacterales bacterium]